MELKLRIKEQDQRLRQWSNYDDIKRTLVELQSKWKEENTTSHNKIFQQEIEIKSLTMK